jgi:3-oxosteroid 1-dehydrogenase
MASIHSTNEISKYDVVVVGSGAAGLTAAITAHDRGLKTAVLERTDKFGGATSASGGMVWIPLNHHMKEVDIADSKEEAMTYIRRLSLGRVDEDVMEAFVDSGAAMLKYIEEKTPVRMVPSLMPDYRPDLPGSKPGGRSMCADLFESTRLGEWSEKLRPAPLTFLPITIEELYGKWHAMTNPKKMPWDIITQRRKKNILGCGRALAAALFKGCLDRNIPVFLETRAQTLITQQGQVSGLVAEKNGQKIAIHASRGVILASGGFEWNENFKRQFLPGFLTHNITPPFCGEGDGLKMAMEAGADLCNMTEAWGLVAGQIPGELEEGRPLSYNLVIERSIPHSILVNKNGRRFVNESCNYNDLYRAFNTFNPSTYEYANLPAWLIFDKNYREKYLCIKVMPHHPDPDWLKRDDTLAGLAGQIGVHAENLENTVLRFNTFAAQGKDPDFLRGDNIYDRYNGDPDHAPNPCLGPIEKPSFYALPVYPGSCGTKGGAKVNPMGQVIGVNSQPIKGLYAAGNVMGGVTGPGYGGAGGTIGPAMTWGYICARNI